MGEHFDWLHRQWEQLRQDHEQLKYDIRKLADRYDARAACDYVPEAASVWATCAEELRAEVHNR